MSPADITDTRETLLALFWQSLAGGAYDLVELKTRFRADSPFQDFMIDSLDLTDFLLRVKDHFQVQVPLENLPNLTSIDAVDGYIREHQRAQPAVAGLAAI